MCIWREYRINLKLKIIREGDDDMAKVKKIKVGEIFTVDNSWIRPKLKLNKGFLDMATQYIYINKEKIDASICTGSELDRIQRNWGMVSEKFEKYKQFLIKKYIKEEKKK